MKKKNNKEMGETSMWQPLRSNTEIPKIRVRETAPNILLDLVGEITIPLMGGNGME